VVDYYGAYTDGKANNAYQALDSEIEDLNLAQLNQRFQQLFEASTNRMTPITSGRMSAKQLEDSQHA